MRRVTPNLEWLRVFVYAAAKESFALAAVNLGVSAGAISQRIRSLEEFLGLKLFKRHSQGVKLTEAGKRYADRVRPLLEQLIMASDEITSADSAPVRVTLLPALAQLWLGPRLDDLHDRYRNMSVEIWADPVEIDLWGSNFDLAIRYGKPPFPGYDHRELLFDEIVPVASPALLAQATLDDDGLPIDAPLMVDTSWAGDFDFWLHRTDRVRPAHLTIQTFSLYSMTVDAVLAGRGYMLGHTALLDDLVAQGKLLYLSPDRVPSSRQFHLLSRTSTPLSKAVATFADWLVQQAAQAPRPATEAPRAPRAHRR